MSQPDRNRPQRPISPMSVGLQWASAITTIGLEMALPPLFGVWVDGHFGTTPLWTVLLAVLGFGVAMRHLWDLSKRLGGRRNHERLSGERNENTDPPASPTNRKTPP